MVIQSLQAAVINSAVAATIYSGTIQTMLEAGCIEAYALEGAGGAVPETTIMRFLPRPRTPTSGIFDDVLLDEVRIEGHPYFVHVGGQRAWQLSVHIEGLDHTLALRLHNRRGGVLAVLKRALRQDGHVIEPKQRRAPKLYEGEPRALFPAQYLRTHPADFLPSLDYIPVFKGLPLRRLAPEHTAGFVSGREFVVAR